MADSEGVLTQEQIDAMLSGRAVVAAAPAAAPPVEAALPPVNLAPTNLDEIRAAKEREEASTAASAANSGALIDLAARVARLEASASQGGAGAADTQGMLAQIQELAGQVASMMAGMQGTVGYAAKQNFVCRSCQQQGFVAAKLNCTCCGEENMWGWWPPQPPQQ
ncbi:MAG: hypothetical protein O2909_08920 [Chloroflexi bacterium]|nr:hypothetical protein [Chloroflexota bacterium]MDA1219549.1 hypothetical protein [Chloroflexota bacterium]